MQAVYGIIGYHLPPEPAQAYASHALAVLQDLQAEVPQSLPVFLAANAVLTLSGVRAYDAYHIFYKHLDQAQLGIVERILTRHKLVILRGDQAFFSQSTEDDIFELAYLPAFHSLWHTYSLPHDNAYLSSVRMDRPLDDANFLAWSYIVEGQLNQAMRDNVLPAVWMNDPWAAHNLRFGMLLGYPAKAVESFLWANSYVAPEASDARAEIACQDAYFSAWPSYTFAPDLAGDAQLASHQELWSDILLAVYDSEWHQQLKQDSAFQQLVDEIDKQENGRIERVLTETADEPAAGVSNSKHKRLE